MVPSLLKLMFFIILSLQLSAALTEHAMNGVSMRLHMKMRKKSGSTVKINVKERLYYPIDFPEYYIKLSVGTPPQDVLLMMDTGSDVVWVACTKNYTCNECNGFRTVFLPSKSFSHVPIKCADPKCRDLCENEGCVESLQKCSQICPNFNLTYGSGSATGSLLSDTLSLPLEAGGRREIKNFAIGCSVLSFGAAGIAGFGRGGLSMPSQLAPLLGHKFAYCLDYVSNSSKIVLGNKAVPRDIPLTYTPFLSNPNPFFFTFYYLGLEAVSIGGKRLRLPSNLTRFDSQGNGGTIIDSGNGYTYFRDSLYKKIAGEFASQIGYGRAPGVENNDGTFDLCYNVSGLESIQWPKFAFHFKGGSDMVLPDKNTFTSFTSGTVCLAMMNSGPAVDGEAVSLGNFQQKNFYILYDREKNRFGFTRKSCTSLG